MDLLLGGVEREVADVQGRGGGKACFQVGGFGAGGIGVVVVALPFLILHRGGGH